MEELIAVAIADVLLGVEVISSGILLGKIST